MSSFGDCFRSLVPSLDERRPLSQASAVQFLLPALLCYYVTAVLVILPRTFPIRVALLPISLLALARCSTALDYAFGRKEKHVRYQIVMYYAFVFGMRVTTWTLKTKPLRRVPVDAPKEENPVPLTFQKTLMDGMDLCFNFRGIGWDWSRGLKIPIEPRDTSSRSSFLLSTIWRTIWGVSLFDLCHYAIQWFSPSTIGSTAGGTIFDDSLPFLQRHARSTIITLLFGFLAHLAIDCFYDSCALIGVLVFRQSPSQWPPVSYKPYLSTSLNEFWSFRWHQTFRDCFVHIGSIPLSIMAGKCGAVLGAFVVSGVLHDLGLWAMGRGTEPVRVSGFFIMNGVGCILEMLFKSLTGRKASGFAGRVWTMGWLLFWGSGLVDAWTLRGFTGGEFIPPPLRLSTRLFGRLPSA